MHMPRNGDKILRLVVAFLSLCGVLGWAAIIMFAFAMGGFGVGPSILVVLMVALLIAFFLFSFLSALIKLNALMLRIGMGVATVCILPFMLYLVINNPAWVIAALIHLAFFALWLIMCRDQVRGHDQ